MGELPDNPRQFPLTAGILLGVGLGGFFDGIVLHQVLQWHHMLTSAGYPADNVESLKINTVFDGLFQATTYVFVVLGLVALWSASHRGHLAPACVRRPEGIGFAPGNVPAPGCSSMESHGGERF